MERSGRTGKQAMENRAATTDAWVRALRARFVEIARRRVPEAVVEDVVQDALTVVCRKHDRAAEEAPDLLWSFQVLRNVIGNHYQREKRRRRFLDAASTLEPLDGGRIVHRVERTPLESLERTETTRLLHAAVDELARTDPSCGQQFKRILDQLAPEETPDAGRRDSTDYVRRFRCRERLRRILVRWGYQP
jgi:DNA-directed RNA polymerase specialized sigma24 family protein